MKFIKKTDVKLKMTVVPVGRWLFTVGFFVLIGYIIIQVVIKIIPDLRTLPLAVILIISFMVAVLVAKILSIRIAVLSLDKGDDSLTIRWIGIIPKEQFKCRLSSITQAGCIKEEESKNSYSNVLRTKDWEEIPIPIISGWLESRSIANHINAFLGAKQIEFMDL